MDIFGDWLDRVPALADVFQQNQPFKHVAIPNFFTPDVAKRLAASFPDGSDDGWCRYRNPIEIKNAYPGVASVPYVRDIYETFQSERFVNVVRRLAGIEELEADPTLHGAGLHAHNRGGKLDVHLDYSINPKTGKQRRLNLIVYVTPDWDPAWGGELQLWNTPATYHVDHACSFNTAVLFETGDDSWHGMPTPLRCPNGTQRRSLAVYYVSDSSPDAAPRFKAQFRALPWQPVSDALANLYRVRSERLVSEADLWGSWESDGDGYW